MSELQGGHWSNTKESSLTQKTFLFISFTQLNMNIYCNKTSEIQGGFCNKTCETQGGFFFFTHYMYSLKCLSLLIPDQQ